jgi:F420-dependent methylenetetrahydromethanopterin dehydrogenase
LVRNRDNESDARRTEAEEERSQAIDAVAAAHDALQKAAALVTLEGPDELLGFLDSLTRIGRSLIYGCQIVPPDTENERVLVSAGQAVPPARAREMYDEAERVFVAAARHYLNGAPLSPT